MTARLLHLYCPGSREDDQQATWERLNAPWWAAWAEIVHCPGPDPLDNAKAVQEHWGHQDDLLLLEQDIVPTHFDLMDLLVCGEPFCAFDFRLSHGKLWSEVPGGTGIGFAKLGRVSRVAVTATPQCPQVPWHDLAGALFERLGECHVHRPPVTHHHGLA